MSSADTVDTGRLGLLLNELRLPAIKALWRQLSRSYARYFARSRCRAPWAGRRGAAPPRPHACRFEVNPKMHEAVTRELGFYCTSH